MTQILIPDNLDKAGLNLLQTFPHITFQAAAKMTREEVMALIPEADALIIRSATKVDAAMMDAAPKLKIIGRAGVGVDNVNLDAATERGIIVMNAPDGNTIATAEMTMALMLALARHIPQAHASLQAGQWDRKTFIGSELRHKTLGIVGFGRIGRAVARRAQAFDMSVIAFDPFVSAQIGTETNVELVSLEDLYARADYITLHALITDLTFHMINAESIKLMKPGVRIINAARGALVDEVALAEAIKVGRVAGAAVDVYEEEPPPAGHPLVGLPHVIDTPHLAASTLEAQDEVAIQIVTQVVAGLLEKVYKNVVNAAVLDTLHS